MALLILIQNQCIQFWERKCRLTMMPHARIKLTHSCSQTQQLKPGKSNAIQLVIKRHFTTTIAVTDSLNGGNVSGPQKGIQLLKYIKYYLKIVKTAVVVAVKVRAEGPFTCPIFRCNFAFAFSHSKRKRAPKNA